ncbi:MAG: lytic murein transglycosylase [Candidatus Magasanikbacteria bacterium]
MNNYSKTKKATQNKKGYLNIKLGVVFLFFIAILTLPFLLKLSKAAQNKKSTTTQKKAQQATSTADQLTKGQRAKLEQKLTQLEQKINTQQKRIQNIAQKERSLQNEISRLRARINKMNLKIEAVNVTLQKLNQDIYKTQQKINRTQNKIEEHKNALGRSIETLYQIENQSFLAILLKNKEISDFFRKINEMLMLQNNLQSSLNKVVKLKDKLLKQKRELRLEKQDVKNLKRIRKNQKQELAVAKKQKRQLLQATESKKYQYRKRLQKTKQTAAEIRKQIFKLVGGGELTFEKAYKYAKLAESATGVRAPLIMAILARESRLGENVGQCNYKNAMHPERDIPVFRAILDNLNIQPNSTVAQVSCPITKHGSYGGAMGPAQFIPSTWAIYGGFEKVNGEWKYIKREDEIRQLTGGDDPSNPWNNTDAFIATALYIKKLLKSPDCQNYAQEYSHVLSKRKLRERCAATKYYAGNRWWTYRFWYGDAVLTKAKEIKEDIEVISSS